MPAAPPVTVGLEVTLIKAPLAEVVTIPSVLLLTALVVVTAMSVVVAEIVVTPLPPVAGPGAVTVVVIETLVAYCRE